MKKRLIIENKSAFQYTSSLSEIVSKICEPLKNFDIKGFGYFKILPSGKYLHITNGLTEFQETYLQEIENLGKYQSIFNNIAPNDFQHSIWNLAHNYDKDRISYISRQNRFVNGIDIYYRSYNGYIENFYFIFPPGYNFKHNYRDNSRIIACLKEFIAYFKEKADEIINRSNIKNYATYHDEIDIRYKTNKKFEKQLNNFLSEIQKNEQLYHTPEKIQISNREKEILGLVYKSAKEVARTLNISHKTVQRHIENIKLKTGITSKSELIDFSIKNNYSDIQ